jgi:hypothetical protein
MIISCREIVAGQKLSEEKEVRHARVEPQF